MSQMLSAIIQVVSRLFINAATDAERKRRFEKERQESRARQAAFEELKAPSDLAKDNQEHGEAT